MKILFMLIFFLSFLNALSIYETKHLLNRSSFSYTKDDLKLFSTFSKNEAVSFILKSASNKDVYKIPKFIKEVSFTRKKFKTLTQSEKKILRKNKNNKMKELQIWWLKMMQNSSYSFREKMTLFWHNHFVSSYKVVKNPSFMYEQNKMFRENALGSFSKLLHNSSNDLAMLVYLDNNSNKKSHPNENFARELLELFTLGEGNYNENDIKEAARAFTGYRVNKRKNILKKINKYHDFGKKTFLNKSGYFDAKDIINIILKEEQTSIFIVSKLYKEFISQKTNNKLINSLAKEFRNSNYDISLLMKSLLLSKDFWNTKDYMIKSPIEFIISSLKHLNIKATNKEYKYLLKTSKNLEQDLFNPPNVKGWKNDKNWIDSNSLVLRHSYIKRLINKKMTKEKMKYLNINSMNEFEEYFFPTFLNNKDKFINKKRFYTNLLNKSIYQLK